MAWSYLPYTLRLDAPLLVRSPGGDPNSAVTLPYLPGAAVQGAVAAALGSDHPDFETLVLSGDVRYLNAYPASELDGEFIAAAVPVPLTWRSDKDDADVVHDLAHHVVEGSWPETGLAGPPGPFVTLDEATPDVIAVRTVWADHHQRDRREGRATAHAGTVFSYRAVAAGQTLAGAIQIRSDDPDSAAIDPAGIAGRLRELLAGARFGRSRSTGYGGAGRLEVDELGAEQLDGPMVLAAPPGPGCVFQAVLTAPAVLRDPASGQLDPAGLASAVVEALGDGAEVIGSVVAATLVGGHNARWGVPLPQRLAATAGSAVVLRQTALIDQDRWDLARHGGIGERRVVGCGRLVFLDAPQPTVPVSLSPDPDPSAAPAGPPPPLVGHIETAIADRLVRQEVLALAATIAAGASGSLPPPSFLGRLRRTLHTDSDIELTAWAPNPAAASSLSTLDGKPAMAHLRECRLGDVTLYQWARTWAHADADTLAAAVPLDAIAERAAIADAGQLEGLLRRPERVGSYRRLLIEQVLAGLQHAAAGNAAAGGAEQ